MIYPWLGKNLPCHHYLQYCGSTQNVALPITAATTTAVATTSITTTDIADKDFAASNNSSKDGEEAKCLSTRKKIISSVNNLPLLKMYVAKKNHGRGK